MKHHFAFGKLILHGCRDFLPHGFKHPLLIDCE
jgi:hypothetical protein